MLPQQQKTTQENLKSNWLRFQLFRDDTQNPLDWLEVRGNKYNKTGLYFPFCEVSGSRETSSESSPDKSIFICPKLWYAVKDNRIAKWISRRA
ncbi:hypothetical protein CDAR_369921 [Caerostris darwini]|uniref:Ycf15 n=1 Tax=Caerostris darwini TaxID=1538125 RepID=A0AAV4Q2X4_9ARAC|nr:hypothetical protein CDAR_369921 [Caerostris darwini]